MNSVEISRPSGQKDVFHGLPADFIYTTIEAKGIDQKATFAVEAAAH